MRWKLRPLALAVGLLLIGAVPAGATHVLGQYEGTLATGGKVSFLVHVSVPPTPSVASFAASPWPMGKTEAGQECRPAGPPENPLYNEIPIVDHAFSDTAPPTLISGSFASPLGASGTLRITTESWFPPPGEPRLGSTCDTGAVSWTASCTTAVPSLHLCSAVPDGGGLPTLPPTSAAPIFSSSGSRAKVSRGGRVTLPLTIGCPPPGAECRVSVAATALLRARAAVRRTRVKVGRLAYAVKVGASAQARFKLTPKGRRLLRRLRRVRAKVEITVTRATAITKKTVTVRLKAPKRTQRPRR